MLPSDPAYPAIVCPRLFGTGTCLERLLMGELAAVITSDPAYPVILNTALFGPAGGN